jgi:N-acetylmuramoyl-L-alanine amidase
MSDQDILARTIWGEFRSGGAMGMHAVANVVMNRVAKQSWYGKTITEVCLKNADGVYQFDCNDPDDPNFDLCENVTLDDPQFKMASDTAALAVSGQLSDITRGALNYFTDDGSQPMPGWAKGKTPSLEIGKTLFFNNVG